MVECGLFCRDGGGDVLYVFYIREVLFRGCGRKWGVGGVSCSGGVEASFVQSVKKRPMCTVYPQLTRCTPVDSPN